MFEEEMGWDGCEAVSGNPLAQLRMKMHQNFLTDCLAEGVVPTNELWHLYEIAAIPDLRVALPQPSIN